MLQAQLDLPAHRGLRGQLVLLVLLVLLAHKEILGRKEAQALMDRREAQALRGQQVQRDQQALSG